MASQMKTSVLYGINGISKDKLLKRFEKLYTFCEGLD